MIERARVHARARVCVGRVNARVCVGERACGWEERARVFGERACVCVGERSRVCLGVYIVQVHKPHTYTETSHTRTHAPVHTCTRAHAHMRTRARVYVYVCVCVRSCVHYSNTYVYLRIPS